MRGGSRLRVFDNFLADAAAYRARALELEYKTYEFPEATFHGIAQPTPPDVPLRIAEDFRGGLTPTLSFFRKSPRGQVEPHFIHTDIDMGQWSAILYLNPDPPPSDGTAFWVHLGTGARESLIPHERSEEGRTPNGWKAWRVVKAKFNRLVMFPSSYFHSRAIFDNWGAGDGARLTQVVFGRGELL